MPSTRSRGVKDVAEPGLVSPTPKPVKSGRQSKKNMDRDKESYPISNEPTAPIRQTKAKKGASQKAAMPAPELAGGASDEPTPVIPPQLARKRGRKPADEVESAPPAKKAKDDEVGVTQLPSQPAAKTTAARKKADTLPRAPLPDRQGRNVHPAGQPVRRRTSAEVAAEQETKRKAIEDKIRELEKAKQLLAELNVAEDLEMDVDNPQRLSAAARKRTRDELDYDSDGGEAFDFADVDAIPDSDLELLEEPAPKAKAPKKPVKPARGAVRKEVQERENAIRGTGGDVNEDGSRKKVKPTKSELPPLDAVPKKYQNAGLRKDLKSKKPEDVDPFASGGLNDEDTYSERPKFPPRRAHQPLLQTQKYPENLQRDPTRRNELVQVSESSGQSVPEPQANVQKIERKKTSSKKGGSNAIAVAPPTVPVLNSAPGNAGNGAQFLLDSRWKDVFNPSLSHALYTSRDPFSDFTLESPKFLAIVQKVFNASFPDVTFSLTSDDPVVEKAYERVKTRKSKIGSDVLTNVKDFFKRADFSGQSAEIKSYVRWALTGGPAYYGQPTPRTCKAKKDEPGYIAPDGFLESEFITPVAQHYLNYARNSGLHPLLDAKHPPKGLYAMILVSVERAFKAHLPGGFTAPPPFGYDKYWQAFGVWLKKVDGLSERRWKHILSLGAIANAKDTDEDLRADESMISAYRAEIVIPSSPMKA